MESVLERSRKVLVVEESTTAAKIHKFLLHRLGFQIVEFFPTHGNIEKEVLDTVRASFQSVCIDVILLPNLLADSNGPRLAYQIRNLGYKGLIIAVTSDSRVTDIGRFLESGADNYIVKPLTEANLLAALEGLR